jgi:hypothetical protein
MKPGVDVFETGGDRPTDEQTPATSGFLRREQCAKITLEAIAALSVDRVPSFYDGFFPCTVFSIVDFVV